MGKRSVKENKNIYQLFREEIGYTREKAGEQMGYVSADRIEKIESEKSIPHPDEILAMANCYKKPILCNYYCSHECPIGIVNVPELQDKELSQIVLELLSSLNTLNKKKDLLIDISADGEISEEEYTDFADISLHLDRISTAAGTLNLWIRNMIAEGNIDEEKLNTAMEMLK